MTVQTAGDKRKKQQNKDGISEGVWLNHPPFFLLYSLKNKKRQKKGFGDLNTKLKMQSCYVFLP